MRSVSKQKQGGFYYFVVYHEVPKNFQRTDRCISHNVAEYNKFPYPGEFYIKIMQSIHVP